METTFEVGGNTKRSRFGKQSVTLDFDALPDESKAFVIRYGLRQYIADGMAGAESEADAKAGVDARVANLKSGDFKRARGEGDKPDTEEARAFKLAKTMLRDQLKAANQTAEKDVVADGARKLLETTEGPMAAIAKKLKAEAKRQVEAERKAREDAADDEAKDVLGLLGLVPNGEEEEPEVDETE